MQHLDLETLARLVDEAPEPHEAEHLRGCLFCRRELAALREQHRIVTAALSDAPEVGGESAGDGEPRLVAKLIGKRKL